MILVSLFPGQEQRQRCREQTCGRSRGKERVGRFERVALTYVYTIMCKIRALVGSCFITPGAQRGALGWPRELGWGVWEEDSRGGGSIWLHMAHLFWSTAETGTTTCKANYPPTEKKKIKQMQKIIGCACWVSQGALYNTAFSLSLFRWAHVICSSNMSRHSKKR